MGIYAIKPQFQKLLVPAAGLCVRLRIPPDLINLGGLSVSLCVALSMFFSREHPFLFWVLPAGAFIRAV
jgi:hypothetical protein